MVSKKKEDKIVENASLVSIDLNEKLIRQKRLRDKVRKTVQILNKQNEDNSIYPRQVKDIVDTFTNEIYSAYNLVSPPYAFSSLYDTYEQSDVLQECVDAMAQNVDGFGYLLKFLGNDVDERTTEDAELQKIKAENFFDHINETESFLTLRKEMRKDYEIIGNSALEVLRNLKGDIAVMYNIPFRTIRLTKIDYTTPVWVETTLKRDGKDIPLKLKKYFRKFAQIKDTGESIRWFKEFGDPRVMDAQTGEYVSDDTGKLLSNKKIPSLIASELIHFKNNYGGRTYGLPRWIGVYLDVKGRTNAQFVNYDLFNNQGIPPMAVMVSGGTLTDESVEELEALVRGMRGASQWNKVVLLESNLESSGLEDKGSAKIELKNLTEYRKDDQMFERYIKATERSIRYAYRLPPLYVGAAESFCVSEDTETLTENGWKKYWEIKDKEKIATLNPLTNELEYHYPIDGLHLFEHKGEMISFKNTATDMLVTPNHKMYISLRRGYEWKKVEARDIFQTENPNYRVLFKVSPENYNINDLSSISVPLIKRRTEEKIDRYIDADLLILFSALYIGDGHSTLSKVNKRQHYNIILSAKKNRKIKIFEDVMERLSRVEGIKVSKCEKYTGHTSISISDRGLVEWIVDNCGHRASDKHIPKVFMGLNSRQSKILLEGLIATDGNVSGHKERPEGLELPDACRYVSTSPALIDQVQIVAFKCGFQAAIPDYSYDIRPNRNPVYYVNLKKASDICVHNFQHEMIDYNGLVYCFEVPNHLFVTRRNGKIGIHGNTHSTSKNARLVAEEQVFMPEREAIDEFVNNQIMQKELNITLWRYSTKGPKIVGSDELSKGVETFSKAGAFTINHAIEMANEAFGLQMSKFSEKWADYPVPIILKLVDLGNFNAIEDILNGENISVDQNIAKINIEKMSDVNSKIIDSELFTDEEKELYKKLITIQQALIAKKG